MNIDNLNPMANLYKEFVKILNAMVIKYNYKAEELETLESKQNGDGYLDAYYKMDNFLTYRDYTSDDFDSVGLTDYKLRELVSTDLRKVPEVYRQPLLEIRRQRVLDNYDEQNNYYRMLNGLPDIGVLDISYHYVPTNICNDLGIDPTIPIHRIQDYYNKINPGDGDMYIHKIENEGVVKKLIELYPNEEYLKYIGNNRISIAKARSAKNFELIRLDKNGIRVPVYDAFIELYEQCRDYFVSSIYNYKYRTFMKYYDNFIAMCIMVMTIQQLMMKQIPLSIKRDFFDIYALKMLYEVYNIPYNLYIDDNTQKLIAQNLNLLINNKGTNKVIYDVAELLGFPGLTVYKYYLLKERKYDIYGAPIVQFKQQFNTDTGEYETIPDYEAMYDVYFQKEELMDDDFVKSFNSKVNMVAYESVVSYDPFWWEDQNLYDRMWATDYNFVETKYMSVAISYKLTDIIFENILFLKLIMSQESPLKDVKVTIPKIIEYDEVSLFDLVILLICLMLKKHNLTGEIISVPSQVINVMDYMHNKDTSVGTVDTFSFDFDYLTSNKGVRHLRDLQKYLSEDEYTKLMKYLEILSINSNATPEEKIRALNDMYSNIKGLSNFLRHAMSDADNREKYECLKTFYHAVFYSREMKSVFEIHTNSCTRTACNYFEFLYYQNRKLYNAVFEIDFDSLYAEYSEKDRYGISYDEYIQKIENGEIEVKYDTLKKESGITADMTADSIYFYINHIISRMKTVIDNIGFLHLSNECATPLEDLMMKLIRFVKSFTVDLLGLDVLYVCDLKDESMIRLMDEVYRINKSIVPEEHFKTPISDSVHSSDATLCLKDSFGLKDQVTTYFS